MSILTIERVGGIAGFGLPNSHVQSRGQVEWEQLSSADRTAIDELFAQRNSAQGSNKASRLRDAFVYRLTRPAGSSTETIEVSEAQVPAALLQSVKDELV